MDPDRFRVSLRAIFAAIVAEIPDQFLFLGVDRNHRLLLGQCGGHLGVDAGELRIPVGVAVALFGFAVGLQAVARRIEQFGHQGAAHLVALRLQRLRQPAHAPAGPPQRRFRIPAGRWFDQRLEIRQQGRVPRFREGRLLQIAGLRPAPGRPTRADGSSCANSFRPRPIVLGAMPVAIATPAMPPYPAANASAAATRRRPRSSRNGATVKNRSNGLNIDHDHHIWYEKTVVNSIFTLSKVDSIISGRALRRRRPMMTEIEVKRARLATLERELCWLGSRHDLAMSAFKFDEARDLQQQIAKLERERAELAKTLPAVAPPPTAAPVPVMIRRRRPRRR